MRDPQNGQAGNRHVTGLPGKVSMSESSNEQLLKQGPHRPGGLRGFKIVEDILATVELIRSKTDGRAYAKIRNNASGNRIYSIRSPHMRAYVSRVSFLATTRAEPRFIDEVLNVLDGNALFGGEERNIYVRFARTGDGAGVAACSIRTCRTRHRTRRAAPCTRR